MYTSDYDEKALQAYKDLANRQEFTYKPAEDPLYNQYSQAYKQLGEQSAKQTVDFGKTQRGGYGDTYIDAVGQQTYDEYLLGMNDNITNLAKLAQDSYNSETDRLSQIFSNANTLSQQSFDRYMDEQNLELDRAKFEYQKAAAEAAKSRGSGGGSGNGSTLETDLRTMLSNGATTADMTNYASSYANLTGINSAQARGLAHQIARER